MERDIVNHVFRVWVDSYAKIVATSDTVPFSLVSFLLFPYIHGLRMWNYLFLIPFLPQPRVYDIQVKAEIEFQRQSFLGHSEEALGNIDFSLLSIQNSGVSTSLTQQLGAATMGIEAYQRDLNQSIDALRNNIRFEGLRRFFSHESQQIKELRRSSALIDRVLIRLRSLHENVARYESDFKSLRMGLHQLRRSFKYTPDFEFSPAGLVSIPPKLSVELKLPPFLVLKRRGGREEASGSGKSEFVGSYDSWAYDLSKVNDNEVMTQRAAIAEFCKESDNYVMRSGFLYTVCNIWSQARLLSGLDDDLLGGVQRSWVMARDEAVHRYRSKNGLDVASIVDNMRSEYDSIERCSVMSELRAILVET